MPITKEVTLYTFEELSDKAKERARDWWRAAENDDFDPEYEDFTLCAEALGIEFKQRRVDLMGGGVRYEPTIYWSGFYSQGDGACFEGRYAYKAGCQKLIRQHAPKDEELHRIADELAAVQRLCCYKLTATMEHRGHYYHSGCMQVDVSYAGDEWRSIEYRYVNRIEQAMRDFADWMYKQLRTDYEWRMEDEQVDESIIMNEYTFDEEGNRED